VLAADVAPFNEAVNAAGAGGIVLSMDQ